MDAYSWKPAAEKCMDDLQKVDILCKTKMTIMIEKLHSFSTELQGSVHFSSNVEFIFIVSDHTEILYRSFILVLGSPKR